MKRIQWAAFGAIFLLGACVQLIGIEEPIDPPPGDAGGSSGGMVDDPCKDNAPMGTPCNETGVCDGLGNCQLGNGSACSLDSQCFNMHCVDGACCDSACTGRCQACAGQGTDGTCGFIKAGTDPNDECTAGACDGAGECKADISIPCTQATECATGFCVDGVCCATACTETCKACNVPEQVGSCVDAPSAVDDQNSTPTCTGTNQSCNGQGECKLELGQTCTSPTDCLWSSCLDGVCTPPSCNGLPAACGLMGNENCCASNAVEGGSYNRGNDVMFPAKVNGFRFDRFEVTVGRFRKFVEAYQGNTSIITGAGKHPSIAGSGWDSAWNTSLPVNKTALMSALKCNGTYETWRDTMGGNESLPINCVSWHVAFAFCIWDGGRLPTESEWNYAAAGGTEQRKYAWPDAEGIDANHAVYNCRGDGSAPNSCAFGDILKVGSKSPTGDGRWQHADLTGSVWEWTLDWFDAYVAPCNNCAKIDTGTNRVIRGGGWYPDASQQGTGHRNSKDPAVYDSGIGFRCARNL